MPTQLTNTLELLSGNGLLIGIIGFIIVSYLIVALLTWSLRKPLKYLSIPFIIVGILILLTRMALPTLVKLLLVGLNIPDSLITPLINPFLKSGLTCLITGIAFIIIYNVIGALIKRAKNKKVKPEIKEETTEEQKENELNK